MIWIYYVFKDSLAVMAYDCKELGRGRLHYHRFDGSEGIAESGRWEKRLVFKSQVYDERE